MADPLRSSGTSRNYLRPKYSNDQSVAMAARGEAVSAACGWCGKKALYRAFGPNGGEVGACREHADRLSFWRKAVWSRKR